MKTLYINARFIDRPVTGVERVARELTQALLTDFTDDQGVLQTAAQDFRIRLIAPRVADGVTQFCGQPIVRRSVRCMADANAGALYGHFWEQFELPVLTRGGTLLNLCNLTTLLKADQFVFIHDAQPFAIPGAFQPWLRAWYQINYRLGARRARRVLVNSHFTRNELQKYIELHQEKANVCHLGCDHINRVDAEISERTQIDQPFFLAFAAANPNKNFRLIIHAMRHMGEAAPLLVVVGDPANRIFANARLPAERAIHLGRVSDGELAHLLNQAAALIYPSIYEGFGLPPLEAMALGCPVIVSDQGALPEVVDDAGLYCGTKSERSLANNIRAIQNSALIKTGLQKRGRERAAEFTWSNCARSLVAAISNAQPTDTSLEALHPRF